MHGGKAPQQISKKSRRPHIIGIPVSFAMLLPNKYSRWTCSLQLRKPTNFCSFTSKIDMIPSATLRRKSGSNTGSVTEKSYGGMYGIGKKQALLGRNVKEWRNGRLREQNELKRSRPWKQSGKRHLLKLEFLPLNFWSILGLRNIFPACEGSIECYKWMGYAWTLQLSNEVSRTMILSYDQLWTSSWTNWFDKFWYEY